MDFAIIPKLIDKLGMAASLPKCNGESRMKCVHKFQQTES